MANQSWAMIQWWHYFLCFMLYSFGGQHCFLWNMFVNYSLCRKIILFLRISLCYFRLRNSLFRGVLKMFAGDNLLFCWQVSRYYLTISFEQWEKIMFCFFFLTEKRNDMKRSTLTTIIPNLLHKLLPSLINFRDMV